MSRIVGILLMLAAWLALWGEVSIVNVVSGVVVVALLSLVVRRTDRAYTIKPIGLIKLLGIFVWRLITSSAAVVLTVVAPTPARLRSGVVAIELSHHSPLVAAIVADAISLTPGTLTLDSRYPDGSDEGDAPPTLIVHVLGLDDPEEIRDDVRYLEGLVLSAIAPNGHPVTEEVSS